MKMKIVILNHLNHILDSQLLAQGIYFFIYYNCIRRSSLTNLSEPQQNTTQNLSPYMQTVPPEILRIENEQDDVLLSI